jgi:hypothetical protein
MTSPNPINTQSSFLPPELDFPENNEEFREVLSNRQRLLASIVNVKENANYERRELITAQQWFSQVSQGYIKTQYGFRLTFDLISLFGGAIPIGTTSIPLPTNPAVNTPTVITYTSAIQPTHGFGGATIGTTFYFVNDPEIFVRFINTSTTVQSVEVHNLTASSITQFYWVFEYLKQ